MKVTDPTGDTWRVGRRWLPWRPRRRRVDASDASVDLAGSADDLVIAAIILVVVVVVAVVAPWIFVGAVLAVEILVVVLLLPLFVLLRGLRVARWPVAVRRGRSVVWEESVRGWRGSRDRIREIAGAISRGDAGVVKPSADDLPRHL